MKSKTETTFLTINSGGEGAESCDWAAMLMRMYQQWCKRRGFECEIDHFSEGIKSGVGLTSVMLQITGLDTGKYLTCEQGVHRLIRYSPFDASARRHTSFACVNIVSDATIPNDVDFTTSVVRSCIIHPYELAKDHETGHETSAVQEVLYGDIDGFIDARLRQNPPFQVLP